MKSRKPVFCEESEWFYRLYAQENQVDYLQLCLLDLLRMAGGVMTWKNIYLQIPSASAVTIRQTAEELAAQQLVTFSPDCLILSDLAEFFVDEILDDLHHKMEALMDHSEDSKPNLMA